MSTAPVIRRARPEDLAAAGRLGAELVRFHHALDEKRFFLHEPLDEGYAYWLGEEIKDPKAVILVAEEAAEEAGTARIIGYAYGVLEGRDWHALRDPCGMLHDLYVADGARAHGVGEALLREMTRIMREMGAPRVVLTTAAQNERAQRLFRKMGFRVTMLEMTCELADDTPGGGDI